MGRQFTMNAAMLFVALTFWWWAWASRGLSSPFP